MSEEPTLPKLLWRSHGDSLSDEPPRLGKRVRLSSPLISSDSAIFSSDDDPSAENYTTNRQKKKYKGPWFQQEPVPDSMSQDSEVNGMPKKQRRKFERHLDSGVWLGSDSTDMEDEYIDALKPRCMPTVNDMAFGRSRGTQTTGILGRDATTPESLASKQIERCLEEGNESIDLS